MNEWVEFYRKVLGFEQLVSFDDQDISTEYSALMSKVVQSGRGRIKFPINEPAQGRRKSQIEEYIDFYGGAGVQHIAMATNDIIHTVRALRDNDVTFLRVPKTYYDHITDRVGEIKEDINELAELEFWSIEMTRDTCSRYLPNPFKIDQLFSLKSFSVKAQRASAKATSKPSSKPSNASKTSAEHYERDLRLET